jgi:hypothetical protein
MIRSTTNGGLHSLTIKTHRINVFKLCRYLSSLPPPFSTRRSEILYTYDGPARWFGLRNWGGGIGIYVLLTSSIHYFFELKGFSAIFPNSSGISLVEYAAFIMVGYQQRLKMQSTVSKLVILEDENLVALYGFSMFGSPLKKPQEFPISSMDAFVTQDNSKILLKPSSIGKQAFSLVLSRDTNTERIEQVFSKFETY